MLNEISSKAAEEVSDISSRAISFAKKNPALTVAAVLGVGFMIVKLMSKPKNATSEIKTDAKRAAKKLAH